MVCRIHIVEVQEGTFTMTNFAFHNISICSFCFMSDLLTAYVTSDIQYKNENTLQISWDEWSPVQFICFVVCWQIQMFKKHIESQTLVNYMCMIF